MKSQFTATLFIAALALPRLASAQADAAPADEALKAQMERGKTAFMTCAACHGMDGKGLPTTPPMAPSLVGSKLATAPAELPATVVLKGIQKTDAKYLGLMAPLGAAMTDDQIADVLTYVRNSWGNKAAAVTPAEVKAAREKNKEMTVSPTRADIEKKLAELEARK